MESFSSFIAESKMDESVETDTLKGITDSLKRQYGLEASLSKSTLGGGEPSYFLKVFGPKDTWKNDIALNSPFHVMIRIADGELEMPTVSYQVRNAKAKMRKTKFKNNADLEKKLMDYFKKNKTKIDGILGESFIREAKSSDYNIYHKTFSSAVQHALSQVEKQGYEVDGDEWDRKVAMGPRKPSRGKTNIYTIDLMKNGKETKRKLQMQVYYDEGRYELNMYIS